MLTKDKNISLNRLARITFLLEETKKRIGFDKGSGLWWWVNRDEEGCPDAYHCNFFSWLEAATDAVEPYLKEE